MLVLNCISVVIANSKLTDSYSLVTAFTAAVSYANIQNLYKKTPSPSSQLECDWKHHLDGCATEAMEYMLSTIEFESISVGSEGAKEAAKVGLAAPSLEDKAYGNGKDPSVIIMSDVLEGTTFASRNSSQASSVISAYENEGDEFGIRASEEDSHYLWKFFGPKQANGVIDPTKSHTENLKNLLEVLDIKNPNDLIQISLDPNINNRECNRGVVDEALALGVDVRLIEHGDFIAGLRAVTQPKDGEKYVIVVGRGGYEEGIMDAVAARAVGGFAQIQMYDKQNNRIIPEVMELDTLVSKDSNRACVFNSFITDENLWFDKPGVRLVDDMYKVITLVVDSNGFRYITHEFKKEEVGRYIKDFS